MSRFRLLAASGGALVVFASLGAACARRTGPSSPPGAPVTASQAAPSASASASVQVAAPDAKRVPLRVTLALEDGAAERTLVATVAEHGRFELAQVKRPFACAASRSRGPEDSDRNRQEWLVACDPAEPAVRIAVEQGELHLGSQRLPIEPTARIELEPEVRLARPPCAASVPAVPVDATLSLVHAPDGRRLATFKVPALGLSTVVDDVHRPEACDSERLRQSVTFWCMSQEAGSRFTASVEAGVLRLDTRSTNYGEDYQRPLGALELPCGAQLRFNRLQVLDPSWSGIGLSHCDEACNQRQTSCEDACRTRQPASFHDDGRPARDTGEDCLTSCQLAPCPCRGHVAYAWTSTSAATSALAPPGPPGDGPLQLRFEVASKPDGTRWLFALVPELELRVPLEEVRAPFACALEAPRHEPRLTAVSIGCDPTERLSSAVYEVLLVAKSPNEQPGALLEIEPRRCAEACVHIALPAWRALQIEPQIAGDSRPPCAPVSPRVPLSLALWNEPRFGNDAEHAHQARLSSGRLVLKNPDVASPLLAYPGADQTCASAVRGDHWVVSCSGGALFSAAVREDRLEIPGRGAVPLPCGATPRWPHYERLGEPWSQQERSPRCELPFQRCLAECLVAANAPNWLACQTRCAAAPAAKGCAKSPK